eukprot:gene4639-6520_t
MGATASVKLVYAEATDWFKQYFDSDLYLQDFHSIDKDHNGNITYLELESWIKQKAFKEGGSWQKLLSNQIVIKIAHRESCKQIQHANHKPESILSYTEFKYFLIHLFAISVLWAHFKNAEEENFDANSENKTLTFEEFKVACNTLCQTHAHESMTDKELEEAFVLLDVYKDNKLSFLEVSNYCCRFVDPNFEELAIVAKRKSSTVGISQEFAAALVSEQMMEKSMKHQPTGPRHEETMLLRSLNSSDGIAKRRGSKDISRASSVDEKNQIAMDAIVQEFDKNSKSAETIAQNSKLFDSIFSPENVVMVENKQASGISLSPRPASMLGTPSLSGISGLSGMTEMISNRNLQTVTESELRNDPTSDENGSVATGSVALGLADNESVIGIQNPDDPEEDILTIIAPMSVS